MGREQGGADLLGRSIRWGHAMRDALIIMSRQVVAGDPCERGFAIDAEVWAEVVVVEDEGQEGVSGFVRMGAGRGIGPFAPGSLECDGSENAPAGAVEKVQESPNNVRNHTRC